MTHNADEVRDLLKRAKQALDQSAQLQRDAKAVRARAEELIKQSAGAQEHCEKNGL
jgi:ElaB/YqjD/DUF883 family membrane-anchored ribosome-binding protein